jgi:heme/copper-type cytochrome/quinol oxidase subunit 2
MGIPLRQALLMAIPLVVIFSVLQPVLAAEEGDVFLIRVEAWGLFYRGMVIAFTIGAIVMGVIAYVVFRFRESNPKNVTRTSMEGHH